ncbi:MAG: hypothetical protein ABIK89_15415 [Planctomycetota bacterium]
MPTKDRNRFERKVRALGDVLRRLPRPRQRRLFDAPDAGDEPRDQDRGPDDDDDDDDRDQDRGPDDDDDRPIPDSERGEPIRPLQVCSMPLKRQRARATAQAEPDGQADQRQAGTVKLRPWLAE